MSTGTPAAPSRPWHRVEDALLVAVLLAAMLLPLIDTVGRPFGGFHVPGGSAWLQKVTLALAFLGGLLATRAGAHLTLSTAELMAEGPRRRAASLLAGSVAAAVAAVLAWGAWQVVLANRTEAKVLPGGVPVWIAECVMPLALALIALRFAWRAAAHWPGRLAALAVAGGVFALSFLAGSAASLTWPLAAIVLVAALLGAPVFTAMGGLALIFFFSAGVPVAAVPAEIYRLIESPTLPAIPLLTACGYVLAESHASSRLVRFFRALFGWMPGGLAVMVIALCAMFTTFTGGSGVTIIALGGLVYPMLREEGYSEGFSLGLVTAAGSLGLLFPPSLPVILYSVVAGSREMSAPADELYLAGLLPGLLLVVLVALYGIWVGVRGGLKRQPFAWGELARSAWAAKWELLLPVGVVALFQSGLTSLVETAAAALLYAIVVEWWLTGDLTPRRGLPKALVKSCELTGAVLILLASAMGLTSYLVDQQITDALLAFTREHLAAYKVPKAVHVVAEFPVDPQGKILKRTLRDPGYAPAAPASS